MLLWALSPRLVSSPLVQSWHRVALPMPKPQPRMDLGSAGRSSPGRCDGASLAFGMLMQTRHQELALGYLG